MYTPGNDKQPSSAVIVSSLFHTISGLMMTTSGSPRAASPRKAKGLTMSSRASIPTCVAARPRPSSAAIVSIMSFTVAFSVSSKASTALARVRRKGFG